MMTDSTTKSTKSVAPETVRLFEIIGFGQTNEEEYKNKVQNIMEVTGCEQIIAILTLHDCNDENDAIQRLLDSSTGSTQEGWKVKKKDKKKKSATETFETESLDTPKAYVTDGHSGESVEGRRGGVRSRERERDSYGGWKDRKPVAKESGGSWDGEETELSKAEDSQRTERDRSAKNGYSNRPRQKYSNENRYDRRDQGGDRNEDRQNSRVFVNRRNERYQQDGEERYPKDSRNERYGRREDQNSERKFRRPYDDRSRDRNEWESSSKYTEQEMEDKSRGREKRSDKEPVVFDSSANRFSKTNPDINGGFFVNSREDPDAIDWDNPVLNNTDWGAEEARKESDEDVDEDKRIEAILSEGWEFCNPNFDHEDVQEPHTSHVPSKPPNESTGISASSLPIQDNLHPIYSPQTTSLPTPSATIPESRPHSHHQAMGDMFSRLDKMNIKKKIRSKIPQAPVELPALSVDSYDIQFGNVVTLPPAPQEPEDDFKFTDSPSPVNNKTFSNANPQDSELSTSNEQSPPPAAPKSNERPAVTNSPPPKSDIPHPSRSPLPQEKQPSLSAPPPHQTAAPAPTSVPSHSQPPPHYHQHLNRQNERKTNYPDNTGKHHHGGMSGNSVKMQQHPQMPPVNSIDQQTGMPYMMTGPMGSMGLQTHTTQNSLPPTTMSNIPRGLGKNYQPSVIYNTPGGQFSMMPNYYYEQEMMRMIASQNNNPASNMVKDQNPNPVFQNNDSKFHEPTSPANAQSGIQGQNVYLPFPGYGFFPNIFPMMPKSNTFPNPVTAAGQTPFQNPPPMPPNLTAMPDQHNEYKANFSNVPQKTGPMPQASDLQNMYKGFEQKSIPFGFGYPMAQYMTPQMMPPLSQQQPQYSNLNPNMLLQQPHDTPRPKW